ncbi:MAG: EamA family transporter [Chloroflexota bacterium]
MQTIQPRAKQRGLLYVITASTLWGTTGVVSQLIAHLAPTNGLSIGTLRVAAAAPILLLAAWQLLGRKIWQVSWRDVGVMVLMGVMIAINQALYFVAISFSNVTIATLVTICSAPILVLILTAIIERKMPSRFTISIIFLALLGTILLVGSSATQTQGASSLIGVACALGSACAYTGVLLLSKFLSGKYHSLQINAIGFSVGAICLLVVSNLVGFAGTYPVMGWLLILYLGAIPTAFAYGLFMSGMQTTSAPTASVVILLEPLTAAILSSLLFGERLTALGIGGAVLLLGAIYALSRSQ